MGTFLLWLVFEDIMVDLLIGNNQHQYKDNNAKGIDKMNYMKEGIHELMIMQSIFCFFVKVPLMFSILAIVYNEFNEIKKHLLVDLHMSTCEILYQKRNTCLFNLNLQNRDKEIEILEEVSIQHVGCVTVNCELFCAKFIGLDTSLDNLDRLGTITCAKLLNLCHI
ncbi:hypothetical protein ACJX0J_020861 [Zea mays]